MESTTGKTSPEIFRKWAGISCLAGALEQRTWTILGNNPPLYPNLYVFLVGPPGIGKGVAMDRLEELWRSISDLKLSPSSVSKASLMDALHAAVRRIVRPSDIPDYVEYNYLQLLIRELGQFLPEYDRVLMNALTDIYDGKPYEEMKRTNKVSFAIERPMFNFIAGCTPAYLMSTFPEAAWEHGFSSRTIMIYSGEIILSDNLFSAENDPKIQKLVDDLKHDLSYIASNDFFGQFTWSPEASAIFMDWYKNGQEFSDVPKPSHPRLASYMTRRWTHLAKLCMVASVSRACDLRITKADFAEAIQWLMEAELLMEDVFKAMPVAGDAKAAEELEHLIIKRFHAEDRKPVAEHLLVRFLAERIPHHSVQKVIDTMIRSHRLEVMSTDVRGYRTFRPVIQRP